MDPTLLAEQLEAVKMRSVRAISRKDLGAPLGNPQRLYARHGNPMP